MSKNLQEYGACILFFLLVPLLPIILEWWFSKGISSQSLMITAAIYSITTGSSSSSKLIFIISIIIGIIFSACYGIVMAIQISNSHNTLLPENSEYIAYFSIFFIIITLAIEKYSTYVTNSEKCLEFD